MTLSDKEILSTIKKLENELILEDGVDTASIINMNLKDNRNPGNSSRSIINIPLRDSISGSLDLEDIQAKKSITNKQNTGLFAAPDKDFEINKPITYRDILAWRERQEEWKQLERHHKTFINSSISIKTTLVESIVIPVEAAIKKPQIYTDGALEFGPLQIGDFAMQDILIQNPTSETITVQLFISYDLDKSFISKKTNKLAWTDKGAFRDKMLR